MTISLALTDSELAEVCAILAAHLPSTVSAKVFGSRAGGNPKPWSDLDIVLRGPDVLPLSVMAALAEAFDESALPWKVDLVDRRAMNETFGKIVDAAAQAPIPTSRLGGIAKIENAADETFQG